MLQMLWQWHRHVQQSPQAAIPSSCVAGSPKHSSGNCVWCGCPVPWCAGGRARRGHWAERQPQRHWRQHTVQRHRGHVRSLPRHDDCHVCVCMRVCTGCHEQRCIKLPHPPCALHAAAPAGHRLNAGNASSPGPQGFMLQVVGCISVPDPMQPVVVNGPAGEAGVGSCVLCSWCAAGWVTGPVSQPHAATWVLLLLSLVDVDC